MKEEEPKRCELANEAKDASHLEQVEALIADSSIHELFNMGDHLAEYLSGKMCQYHRGVLTHQLNLIKGEMHKRAELSEQNRREIQKELSVRNVLMQLVMQMEAMMDDERPESPELQSLFNMGPANLN
jgi:hypothetical protein